MCEPAHSIVQYPGDYDDSDLPFGDTIDKESRLKAALGKAFRWTKKIGEWFHFSHFGSGHGGIANYRNTIFLPTPLLYEGEWWERKFHFDGWGAKPTTRSTEAARTYHDASVMGNMSLFRRFLETSMTSSSHPRGAYVYVEALLEKVFTAEGANKLLEKFRRVFGRHATPAHVMSQQSSEQEVEKAIKITMGFTRKRKLFLPHFADDTSLWVPGDRAGG